MERIAIIGLGLIGGSIGLALKRTPMTGIEIAGTARTRETAQKARKLGAIDVEARTAEDAVRDAKLVIIASPILAMQPVLQEIAPALREGAVVTDAGSTKANVMRWAREILPDHAEFIGGHPMAGKESSGIGVADADLFRGKPWVVVPSVRASEGAIQTVVGLAAATGAEPVFMDADEHDSYVAAISHLPLALSSALFSVAFGSAAWPELAALASSGFRDTTRLASGSAEMAHDIMLTNRDNILHWIDRFQEELSRLRATIASGEGQPVLEAFARIQIERDNYVIAGPPRRDEEGERAEKVSLSDMLLGTALAGYVRKQQEMVREMDEREKKKR
jgi:prephenate dehydrogenase